MGSFLRNIVGFFAVVFSTVCVGVAQPSYPIYVSVQVVPPAGVYLTDYYSGTRDRLVVTLLNRDNEQPVANVKLRVVVRNSSVFELRSREELYYPMLTLESGVPLRLTSMDLQPYLAPDRVAISGYLENGRLPNGMTEFRVQVLDYTSGRVLSEVGVGRAWLESKQPPLLSQPSKEDLVALRNPQHIRFQWMPRHQGLAQTEYEFVLKELPEGGVPPQTAFLYGPEIYRTDTRRTTLDYGTMEPPLEPGKKYGWQIRAKAMDGVDEIGVFENQGYSEISWFEVSDNCPEVSGITAKAGFRRIDLSWHHHPDQNAFVVQWRPKTQSAMYEWQSATVFEASHTITQLQEGWTYEYRVGSLCIRNEPLFGPSGEATLPDRNEERIQNCGKVPAIDLSNQEPNESLKVGDMVRIGGDFPMRVDELTPLGNGWYSGKGGLVLPWIFEIGVNLEFARLRVNTDNVQIDGEVETSYDEGEALIGNTNQLDNGGSKLEQGGIDLPSIEVDFTVPDRPSCTYNEDTGKLVIADENGGNPHTVTVPKNEGKSSFPIEVVDAQGNRYQVDLPADADTDLSAADSTATGGAKEPLRPTITKIEDAAGTINTKELSKEAEFNIRFTRGEGKYAFDEGREDWLQDSKLLCDEYYKRFGENYVAPWKLVPVGQTDEVTATPAAGEGFDQSKLDRSKIKFVTADGKGVAAKDDGTKWVLTVPATGAGQTIDVFAVYEKNKNRPLTVGKLRVVSYAVQRPTVTLVPVGVEAPDAGELQRKLNTIYAPYGVEFTVKVDDVIKDLEGWKGRAFKLEGNGFFTRENADMAEVRKAYQAVQSTPKGSYYVFVLGRADASSEDGATQANGAQGDMPRGQQFGYVFGDGVQDWSWLLAHELGHGVFTLQHLEDGNYGAKGTLGSIANLMNYTRSTELQAFQWNIMSNPAILTAFDSDDASKAVATSKYVEYFTEQIAKFANGHVGAEFIGLTHSNSYGDVIFNAEKNGISGSSTAKSGEIDHVLTIRYKKGKEDKTLKVSQLQESLKKYIALAHKEWLLPTLSSEGKFYVDTLIGLFKAQLLAKNEIKEREVVIRFAGNLTTEQRDVVNEFSKQVIRAAAKKANVYTVQINSTIRTARKQVELLYAMIISNKNISYAPPGETLKSIGRTYIANEASREETIDAMTQKAEEYIMQDVVISSHCVGKPRYNKKNTIDIQGGDTEEHYILIKVLAENEQVTKIIQGMFPDLKSDKIRHDKGEGQAIHIEIKQPQ